MYAFFSWYLAVTFIGWLAFPIAYRLLPGLHERGFVFSRALGLLLWGYLFWLLASLGLVRNDAGGWLLAAALLSGLCLWALLGIRPQELLAWLRSRRTAILIAETLFLAAFAGWAIVRAANPEAVGTEKPMELAFINAILRSPDFPPHDPWLSGYGISYYYFGYTIVALLAGLTNVPGGVAFNLGVALIFALSASGAYGLLLNLLNARLQARQAHKAGAVRAGYALAALFGPLFILIVSNLEGFLHMLHRRGLFWRLSSTGELTSAFWTWLGIQDLNNAPQQPFSWFPDSFWWWWRASRVLQDFDLSGAPREIIDEFPFFSYLLGDLHPHVLAMPFALLAMTLALNLFFNGGGGQPGHVEKKINWRIIAWTGSLAIPVGIVLMGAGMAQLKVSWIALGLAALVGAVFLFLQIGRPLADHGIDLLWRGNLGALSVSLPLEISPAFFLLLAVVLGGLAFLNTWDFPVYVALAASAFALRRLLSGERKASQGLLEFAGLGMALGLAGGVLYLPFYLGFSSQAGGILPNLIYPTRGVHLWVMFGSLLFPILAFLIYLAARTGWGQVLRSGLRLAGSLMLSLWVASLLLGLAITSVPSIGSLYLETLGSVESTGAVFLESVLRRLLNSGGWLTLLGLLTLALGVLASFILPIRKATRSKDGRGGTEKPRKINGADAFAILLILFGSLLVTAPEFVFLRDLFGWRMNTIFKFYYQAWLAWGIAAAYASIVLLMHLKRGWRAAFTLSLALIMGAALVYPPLSLWEKTNGFNPLEWTLDSTAYFTRANPDEMAALRWLQQAPLGVVAEAVPAGGGSYTEFGRAATFSGQPGVLGWVGHENQWRGSNQAIGSRQSDLQRLYCGRDWTEAQEILERYNIRYILVGSLEENAYAADPAGCPGGVMQAKFTMHEFAQNLTPVFEQGGVTIYLYHGADHESTP